MKNPFSAKQWNIGTIVLVAWVIASSLYVIKDLWQDGIVSAYNQGITNARVQTFGELVARANTNCEPFSVTDANQAQVSLINVQCLQVASTEEDRAPESAE
jgi:hypothetical protein